MNAADAIKISAILSEAANPYVLAMEKTTLGSSEKAAAVKGMVRVLVFAANSLSPAVATLFTGISVQQVDAMVDAIIAGLVAMYKLAGVFVSKVKDALR